jgi:hypothetical protein
VINGYKMLKNTPIVDRDEDALAQVKRLKEELDAVMAQ